MQGCTLCTLDFRFSSSGEFCRWYQKLASSRRWSGTLHSDPVGKLRPTSWCFLSPDKSMAQYWRSPTRGQKTVEMSRRPLALVVGARPDRDLGSVRGFGCFTKRMRLAGQGAFVKCLDFRLPRKAISELCGERKQSEPSQGQRGRLRYGRRFRRVVDGQLRRPLCHRRAGNVFPVIG